MDSFEKYIDDSYDFNFQDTESYPWLPWIGRNFNSLKLKTLILGESTYNWADIRNTTQRQHVENRLSKKNHLRIVHKNNAIDFNGKSPYARNIERAIFLRKKTTPINSDLLWSNTAYHNLVLRAMKTKKHRPTYKDYLDGWETFIDLSTVIDIDQCIVYGLEKNKLNSFRESLDSKKISYTIAKNKNSVGRNYPRVANIKLNDKEVRILFIRHPSAYFSWKKWGGILHKALNIESLSEYST